MNKFSATIVGAFLLAGLALLGYQLGSAAVEVKSFERSVTVKGLAEREVPANIAIWPIRFTQAGNDLNQLYRDIDANTRAIKTFLSERGIPDEDVTVKAPVITDKSAQGYGGREAQFRYSASAVVTVYTTDIATVRDAKAQVSELGKQGIVLSGEGYNAQTQYLFTGLNDIKPDMIEQATNKAREVAVKFAQDSGSRLGKIKRASQGQFSINPRDANNPHIKKVRVVSTIEYYLTD